MHVKTCPFPSEGTYRCFDNHEEVQIGKCLTKNCIELRQTRIATAVNTLRRRLSPRSSRNRPISPKFTLEKETISPEMPILNLKSNKLYPVGLAEMECNQARLNTPEMDTFCRPSTIFQLSTQPHLNDEYFPAELGGSYFDPSTQLYQGDHYNPPAELDSNAYLCELPVPSPELECTAYDWGKDDSLSNDPANASHSAMRTVAHHCELSSMNKSHSYGESSQSQDSTRENSNDSFVNIYERLDDYNLQPLPTTPSNNPINRYGQSVNSLSSFHPAAVHGLSESPVSSVGSNSGCDISPRWFSSPLSSVNTSLSNFEPPEDQLKDQPYIPSRFLEGDASMCEELDMINNSSTPLSNDSNEPMGSKGSSSQSADDIYVESAFNSEFKHLLPLLNDVNGYPYQLQ